MADTPFVGWFEQLSLADRATVGGKGASLGELTRAGIRVPAGFAVTTAAFERFLAGIDADGSIRAMISAMSADDLPRLTAVTREIRQRIEAAQLPVEVRDSIVNAYGRLCAGADALPVAIRSSATSEDSADASFAGLQDTYLWVHGADAVVRSLRACWASLYSLESVSYRLRLQLPEDNVAMGVVVQRMVNSRSSGVMFTRSPTSGDRSVIAIEGSWGLGSCIVSGEVTPDKYVISKVTGEILARTVSQKQLQHVPDSGAGGVRNEPVPAQRQSLPCVSDAELAQLAQIAKRVEQHYGAAQDIEWAIAADETSAEHVYLLQSRPETVWANRERTPLAAPRARPFDHVLALLSGRNG